MKVSAAQAAADDTPTVIFLPEYHFPKQECEAAVSAGRWEINFDNSQGTLLQLLKWWHPEGEQTLTIKGLVRKYNVAEANPEDAGYLEQCQAGYGLNAGNCCIM